jgi:broad specificity phosphatase PhoE
MNRAQFIASRPVGASWFADINEPAPGGESFMDLYNRTRRTVERINNEAAGQDVIAVAHGGTIKAAIGLALDGQVERALSFDIDNCSITRLDYFSSPERSVWRLPMVNQQPWIADDAHAEMHQLAGPEVKKLA